MSFLLRTYDVIAINDAPAPIHLTIIDEFCNSRIVDVNIITVIPVISTVGDPNKQNDAST